MIGDNVERRRFGRAASILPFLGVVASWGAMLALTWKRWSDPLVDLGRELAIPARLAAGERLYADVRTHFGPLAWELPALAVRRLGPGIGTQLLLTLPLSLAGLVALYRLARRRLDPVAAAVAVSVVAVVPFFFRFGGSMALPYSWGALFVAVLGWWALDLAVDRRWGAAGSLLGVALATRVDATLPFLAALGLALAAEPRRLPRPLLRFAAAVGLAATLLLAPWVLRSGAATLLAQIVRPLVRVPPAWGHLYAAVGGFDHPLGNLLRIGAAAAAAVAALALVVAVVPRAAGGTRRGAGAVVVTLVAAAATAVLLLVGGELRTVLPAIVSLSPLRPLPLVATAASLALLIRAWRDRSREVDAATRAEQLLAFAAAASSGRVLLNARGNSPYGSFGLVLPTLFAALLLLDRFPRFGERLRPGSRQVLRLAALGLLAGAALAHAVDHGRYVRSADGWAEVATPGGGLEVSPAVRGRAVAETLAFLRRSSRPGERLAALPEGGFFNVASGLATPLPWEQVLPNLLSPAEELSLARALEASPPEWVILTNVDFSTWGVGPFGSTWGRGIASVVDRLYEPRATFGSPSDPAYAGLGPGLVVTVLHLRG